MAISQPKTKSLQELLQSKTYKIPMYQRPYAWEKDQVEELWEDIKENNPPYFLGIVIFRPEETDDRVLDVVDGQQRLSTLILLIRSAVIALESDNPDLSKEIQATYINQKPPLEDQPRLTLTLNKRDSDKFESLLLGNEFSIKKSYPSWKNLENALAFFVEKMMELKNEEGAAGIKNFLQKVLKLTFLDIHVDNDSDVYLFFETINDRGMDLSIADLVKNRVCADAAAHNQPPQEAADKIDAISDMIGGGRMKGFLLHYCWSKADQDDPTPRKKLMDWYSKAIRSEGGTLLNNLHESASAYIDFVEPRKITGDNKLKEVLTYLKLLDATRCYPLLLAGKKLLPGKDFIKLCKAIEILTFRHSTMMRRDAKILEGVYYDLTEDLIKGTNIKQILETLKDQASEVSDKVFQPAFAEFSTPNNELARYILLKIEEFKTNKSAALDWEALTLEHILANKLDWDGRDGFVSHLGNHTLLSNPLNRDVSNKEFKFKKEEYVKEKRVELTKELAEYPDFTKETILKRQEEFAELATKIWNPKNII